MFKILLQNFIKANGRSPNAIEMLQLKFKASRGTGQVIPFKQKRDFAAEIKAMMDDGTIKVGEVTKKNDNVLQREMFQNSNLNKPTIEGQMEKITGASNRIKEIQKEIDEMYRPKTDAEIAAKYDKQNKESIQRFKNKMKKDEPEDKADGGRIGFRAGKFVLDKIVAKLLGDPKKVKQAVDDIFPTGDYKYDAQMAADALVENNPRIFKNKLYEDLDLDTQMEIYGAVLRPITNNMAKMRELKKASRPEKTLQSMKENKTIDMSDPEIADEFTKFMKETDPEGFKKLEQTVELANFDPKKVKGNAEGGRIGFQEGGLPSVDPRMNLDYDTLVEQNVDKRLQDPNFLNNIKKTEGTLGPITTMPVGERSVAPMLPVEPKNQPGSLEEYLSGYEEYKAKNPNTYKGTQALIDATLPGGIDYTFTGGSHASHFNDYLESIGLSPYQKNLNTISEKVAALNKGGRAGYYTGGITDIEPDLSDIGHGSDSLMARTRLVSPDGQATTSTGLNYLLAEDNDNIRVPFAAGGGGRRAFLKLLASIGGLTAAAKSGIIGLGEGGAKKAVTETVKQSAGNYPPPYFFKLVEKIKFMGDDITEKAATKDREIVKRYKDFEMTEDVATGDIVIKKRNEGSFYDQDGIISDEYIVYKPGQADEMTKGKKPPAEYEEYTVRPDAEGKLRDSEDGLDSIDEILEEVGDPDSMTLKKADGGRIGFSGGGIFRAIIAKSAAKAGMKPYEYIKATSYKSLPPEVKMFMSKADFEKLKMGQEQMYSNYIDMAKTRKNFQEQVEGGKNTPARELFEGMEKTMDEQSFVPKTVTDKDIGEMELMFKNRFNKGRKDNANGGIQTMLGE